MDITLISDLHGYYPKLEGGDLLIIAGDLTARDEEEQYYEFDNWLFNQNYELKIVIAGNHDNWIQQKENVGRWFEKMPHVEYLCDSGTEFKGLKIWGSPWTTQFKGQNPQCMAFSVLADIDLADKWDLIPKDIDILITHTPPQGILDKTWKNRVGSHSLRAKVNQIAPKLHVFGHIHEQGGGIHKEVWAEGLFQRNQSTLFVNASHVNEYYEPVNKPVRIEL